MQTAVGRVHIRQTHDMAELMAERTNTATYFRHTVNFIENAVVIHRLAVQLNRFSSSAQVRLMRPDRVRCTAVVLPQTGK